MVKTTVQAIEFVKRAHEGQFDRSGQPYWQHPVAGGCELAITGEREQGCPFLFAHCHIPDGAPLVCCSTHARMAARSTLPQRVGQ